MSTDHFLESSTTPMHSTKGEVLQRCMYWTEEDWDTDYWSDLQSDSESENGKCSLDSAQALENLVLHCSQRSRSMHGVPRMQFCLSTATEAIDISREHAETPGLQAEANLASQQVAKRNTKIRPGKSERYGFRKFVEKLKEKVQDEGTQFNFDTLDIPPAFNKKVNTREKIRDILVRHQKEYFGQSKVVRVPKGAASELT